MKNVFMTILIIILCGVVCYVFRDHLFQKGLDSNEVNYKDITEAINDKFNIYLFYTDGDQASEGIKSYFNTLTPEVLDTFTLYTFEVSTSEENKNLLSNVKILLNDESESIPYLVIGNQVLNGYTENDNIKIDTYLNTEKNNTIHYDVLTYIKTSEQED